MHVNARVRQCASQAAISRHEQDGAKTGGISNACGPNWAGQVPHGIIDCQSRLYRTARRTDIQVDFSLRTLSSQEEQLGHHQTTHIFLDWAIDHDDAFAQQP